MNRVNKKIGMGVLWNLASLLMARGASTIFMLFLARLLAPEAFGLIAMAVIVFELANTFVNSGLGAALIQSKQVTPADLNTVFYTNILLSALAYLLIYVGAPVIADFYNQSELVGLIRVMAFMVFFNAAKVVQIAILSREMNFKVQMKANVVGVLVSGCLALSVALLGGGVWSLVVQALASAFCSAAVLWLASEWRPGLCFSTDSFNRLFHFGRNLLVEGLLAVLYQNSYVLVIGRVFSAEITGLYFLAQKVSSLAAEQLTGAVKQATFPALSTLQDNDTALLHKYRIIMQLMMFVIAPVMILIAMLSPVLFGLFLDEKWSGAVPYLQLLCIVGVLFPIHSLNINLLKVKARSDLVLKIGLVKKAINLMLLFLALPHGVLFIVISQVAGSFIALIPNTYFSKKLVGYSILDQIKDVVKPLTAAILCGIMVWCIVQSEPLPLTIVPLVAVFLGVMVYLLVSLVVKSEGIWMIIHFLKNRSMRKKY